MNEKYVVIETYSGTLAALCSTVSEALSTIKTLSIEEGGEYSVFKKLTASEIKHL